MLVPERVTGELAYLDDLNLSRAWCWRKLADAHLAAAMPHLSDDYMGEHWLAPFALLALEAT